MEPYCFQITADNEPRPKYQRSSCATSKKHRSTWKPWNCFKEQLHGFLLTFEWCHGSQMMLISLNRNTAPRCIVEWYNGQSMQLPPLPDQRAHFGALWASRMQSEGWLRWRQLVTTSRPPRFLLIIPTYYMLLLRPFHEHICTVNNATSCGGQDYLIIRND